MSDPSLLPRASVPRGKRKMEGREGDPTCTEKPLFSPKGPPSAQARPHGLSGAAGLADWRPVTLALRDTATGLFCCGWKGNQLQESPTL